MGEDPQGAFGGIIRKNMIFASKSGWSPGGYKGSVRFSRGGLFINKKKDKPSPWNGGLEGLYFGRWDLHAMRHKASAD